MGDVSQSRNVAERYAPASMIHRKQSCRVGQPKGVHVCELFIDYLQWPLIARRKPAVWSVYADYRKNFSPCQFLDKVIDC